MRKRYRLVLVLEILVLTGLFLPSLIVNADQAQFTCAGRYPVCIVPGNPPNVTVSNGYGKLVPQYQMAFQSFATYSNGTVFFDLTGLVPSSENILTFQMQAFGNGTFDIRFKGPPAKAISTDGVGQLFAQASWSQGPEVTFTSQTTTTDILIINYLDVGGGCVPFCVSGQAFNYAGWLLLILIVVGVTMTIFIVNRRAKD